MSLPLSPRYATLLGMSHDSNDDPNAASKADPQALIEAIVDSFPSNQWQDVTILMAVSGGADSTAMLRAFHQLRQPGGLGELCVAHFNHRWRQSDSDEDAKFVHDLCQSHNIKCFLGTADDAGNCNPTEQAAREHRYAFLTETAKSIGARHILTAHTRDDQIETILHRIVRGTGLRGLRGIPKVRVLDESLTVVRPMLNATREIVLAYLNEIDQPFRTDASNSDDHYMRNRIRNQLLPLLRDSYHKDIDSSLLRLASIATEAHADAQLRVDRLIQQSVRIECNKITIRRDGLNDGSLHELRELASELWHRMGWPLQDMGFERFDELANYFADASLDLTTMLPGKVRVEVTRETVTLIRES